MLTFNNKIVLSNDKWIEKPLPPPGPIQDYVTIGSQTWMSKNLAIDDGGEGIVTRTVNYGQGDIVEYYYTWEAALRLAESIQGWHLPSPEEWETLATTVGGKSTAGTKLKSTYGWRSYEGGDGNGTDNYGFTALPAGYTVDTTLYDRTWRAGFWTNAAESDERAYYYYLYYGDGQMHNTDQRKTWHFTVRLISDT